MINDTNPIPLDRVRQLIDPTRYGETVVALAQEVLKLRGSTKSTDPNEVWRDSYGGSTYRVYLHRPEPWTVQIPILQRLVSVGNEPETWEVVANR